MRTLLRCAWALRNARSSPRSWKCGGNARPRYSSPMPTPAPPSSLATLCTCLCHWAQCAGSAELTSRRYLHGGALLFPDSFAMRSTMNSTPLGASNSQRRSGVTADSFSLRRALAAARMSHSTSSGSSFWRVTRGSHPQYVSIRSWSCSTSGLCLHFIFCGIPAPSGPTLTNSTSSASSSAYSASIACCVYPRAASLKLRVYPSVAFARSRTLWSHRSSSLA